MKYLLTITTVLAITFQSCNKGKINDIYETYVFDLNANCSDTKIPDLEGPNTGYEIEIENNNANYPFFNPNNPNEFLYYNQYVSNNIYIYNRVNGSKRILTNAKLLSPPKWGNNGWILLDNGAINRIKENGDSLQHITSGYNPEWNYNCSKFAYDDVSALPRNLGIIYNFQNNTKDTLPFLLGAGKSWQNSTNKIAIYATEESMQGFAIVDINSRSRTLLYKIISGGAPCWINENEFVFLEFKDLYIYNILEGQKRKIAKLCSNENIGYMSYSPISNELITVINHTKLKDESTILKSTKIMILNFNNNSVSYITP